METHGYPNHVNSTNDEYEEEEYEEEVFEDGDDEEIEIVEEVEYVDDTDEEGSYEEEYIEEEIDSDDDDFQTSQEVTTIPTLGDHALTQSSELSTTQITNVSAPPISNGLELSAETEPKATATGVPVVAPATSSGTVKKVKKKKVRESHIKRLGNKLKLLGRSRSRGRPSKDAAKPDVGSDDDDEAKEGRTSGTRQGRSRNPRRQSNDDEGTSAGDTIETPNDASSVKKNETKRSFFRRRKTTDADKDESMSTDEDGVIGETSLVISPTQSSKQAVASGPRAFFRKARNSKDDASVAGDSVDGHSEAAPTPEVRAVRSRTPVRVSRKDATSAEKASVATVVSTTTTYTTTSTITTENKNGGVVKTTVTKTTAVPPNIIKVEDSLMPEYVQTGEPIEYSFASNGSKVYYTNKLERKNLDWEKPDWAQKPALKHTPKKEGTVGPVVAKEDKQIGWEKPSWAKQSVLKPTDRGVALKKGADIALPITWATARKEE